LTLLPCDATVLVLVLVLTHCLALLAIELKHSSEALVAIGTSLASTETT
jgi:hypothetical protein